MHSDETVRDFKVEMQSFTRRGNAVVSIYRVRERHILAARETARRIAAGRGMRKIRVVRITDSRE